MAEPVAPIVVRLRSAVDPPTHRGAPGHGSSDPGGDRKD